MNLPEYEKIKKFKINPGPINGNETICLVKIKEGSDNTLELTFFDKDQNTYVKLNDQNGNKFVQIVPYETDSYIYAKRYTNSEIHAINGIVLDKDEIIFNSDIKAFKVGDGVRTIQELVYQGKNIVYSNEVSNEYIKIKSDPDAFWEAANYTLDENELIYDTTHSGLVIGRTDANNNTLTYIQNLNGFGGPIGRYKYGYTSAPRVVYGPYGINSNINDYLYLNPPTFDPAGKIEIIIWSSQMEFAQTTTDFEQLVLNPYSNPTQIYPLKVEDYTFDGSKGVKLTLDGRNFQPLSDNQVRAEFSFGYCDIYFSMEEGEGYTPPSSTLPELDPESELDFGDINEGGITNTPEDKDYNFGDIDTGASIDSPNDMDYNFGDEG